MDGIKERIKLAISNESINAFAKRCGLRESTIRNLLKGTTPGVDKVVLIADTAGVSLEWLITGRGTMQAGHGLTASAAESAPAPVDEEIMEEVIAAGLEWTESWSARRKYSLTARDKAHIILSLYRLRRGEREEGEPLDRERLRDQVQQDMEGLSALI